MQGEVLDAESDNARKPHRNLPAPFLANIWRPGHSGNPGGKTKLEMEVRRLAQNNSPQTIQRVIEIALDPETEDRVVIVASQIILERAFGKPKEAVPGEDATGKADLSRLSPKELGNLRKLLLKSVGKAEE